MTLSELRARLQSASPAERLRLLGRILREARDTDVWRFTTPAEVVTSWPELQRYLGRRRAFWQVLLQRWQDLGLDGRSPGPPGDSRSRSLLARAGHGGRSACPPLGSHGGGSLLAGCPHRARAPQGPSVPGGRVRHRGPGRRARGAAATGEAAARCRAGRPFTAERTIAQGRPLVPPIVRQAVGQGPALAVTGN
jgi:hypothetical protein